MTIYRSFRTPKPITKTIIKESNEIKVLSELARFAPKRVIFTH